MKILSSIDTVAGRYDAVFCDVWGVIHNGRRVFPGAEAALARLREMGKVVILLTNVPKPRDPIPRQLERLGLRRDAWDAIVTSGDAIRLELAKRAPGPMHKIGPPSDRSLWDGLGLEFSDLEAERYAWTNVRPTAPFDPTVWSPRAGLQAVELRNDLYVMGGRGPFSFETETVLYSDVWKSADLGATWTRTAIDAWPARGYFGAVTHRGRIFVIGGQNFSTRPNPIYPDGCASLPPGVPCPPFLPDSTFFDDVWSSSDGARWIPETTDAPWEGRAGLSAVVHDGAIYVLGGSQGDDASTGGSGRALFNDVWMSRDGRTWTEVTSEAPWAPRAGAAVVSKSGFIYLLGGERGFTCGFDQASPCQPATSTLAILTPNCSL